MVLYGTLKVSYFLTEPFFGVRNLKKVPQEMVLEVDKIQNPQRVLSKFLSFFWNFGHIWKLLKIYRTFSGGSANLLFFFQSTEVVKLRNFLNFSELKKVLYKNYKTIFITRNLKSFSTKVRNLESSVKYLFFRVYYLGRTMRQI